MSLAAIRAALETRLAAIAPALETSWENVDFKPSSINVPFQEVFLLPAEPDNTVFSSNYQEHGILQVTLDYPVSIGSKDVLARAQLIRNQFVRGTSYVSGGITVTIERTPEIGPAAPEDDRYRVPVRIRWYANVPS